MDLFSFISVLDAANQSALHVNLHTLTYWSASRWNNGRSLQRKWSL